MTPHFPAVSKFYTKQSEWRDKFALLLSKTTISPLLLFSYVILLASQDLITCSKLSDDTRQSFLTGLKPREAHICSLMDSLREFERTLRAELTHHQWQVSSLNSLTNEWMIEWMARSHVCIECLSVSWITTHDHTVSLEVMLVRCVTMPCIVMHECQSQPFTGCTITQSFHKFSNSEKDNYISSYNRKAKKQLIIILSGWVKLETHWEELKKSLSIE